jgi:hypothetical protein
VNVFVTNTCPTKSAQDHVDIHCRKMVVELCQLLSTAHFILDGVQVGYKPTHHNHPSSRWVRETSENYRWAFNHFKALCDEFTFRTGKVHKSSEMLYLLEKQPSKIAIAEKTPFAMVMPAEYQKLGVFDQTKAYQGYLNTKLKEWACRDKPIAVQWTRRQKPDWFVN